MFISSSHRPNLKETIKHKVLFGNEPTPELFAILMVYFVQGILGLARLAVSFFLKDELGMSPVEVSALLGIIALPWVIKPIFGFISDGVPIFGYRRRPYLIISGLLGAIAWFSLATIVHDPLTATLAIGLNSISMAFSDVIADSMVVERARQESSANTGSLQSLCWGVSALGGLITAYFSGLLLESFSPYTIFGITAFFPILVTITAWLINDQKISNKINLNQFSDQIKQLWLGISQKSIWLPTAFIFLWQSTPTGDSAFFFFTTNELHFSPEFLGRVRFVTSIAALVGVWLFQKFFRAIPFRTIFTWSTLISTLLGMTTLLLVTHANRALGIDDKWFSLGDSLILTVMGQIAYMPVLILAAKLCPPGIEATFFALLMSVSNLAGLISYESGALLTQILGVNEHNFDNLWRLVVITNLTTLIPLFFINWLPTNQELTNNNDGHNLPVLEPEIATSHAVGQHIMPDFMPDMVPTSVVNDSKNMTK